MIIEQEKETLKLLVSTNESSYNWQKLAEELFELGEVVMKKINKNGTEKEPSFDKIVEEIGDVLLRIDILCDKYNLSEIVKERISNKLIKFKTYIDKEKYIGRI